MNARAKKILRTLVVRYLDDGSPVSSRALANATEISCSSATVRNVMADLEDIGLLVSPHTSAGRIPSVSGMRFFVERLLPRRAVPKTVVRSLRFGLRGDTASDVLRASAEVVSRLTQCVGFVALSPREQPAVRELSLIKLSSSRVLAVIFTDDGDIINRVFSHVGEVREKELNAAAAAYNAYFSGLTFGQAKSRLCSQLLELRVQIKALLQGLLEHADGDDEAPAADKLEIAGVVNLLRQDDLSSDIQRLRELYVFLERKEELLELIERCRRAKNRSRVFIGSECGVSALSECSVVFSPCGGERQRPLGFLGVLGPTRMRYAQVIPTVNIAAELLGGTLTELRRVN